MAKPVGPVCNLACEYCYYLATADSYPPRHAFRMKDATLEALVAQVVEAAPGPVVHFVWHGGEPTLAGLGFFRRVVELQRLTVPSGWQCWNSLQTNGTLLDDRWAAFLAEEGFAVGLSVDGTAACHDAYRRDRRGRPTFSRAARAATVLRRHGIVPDLLCTVNAATVREPVAVYRSLVALGGRFLQFLPVTGPDAAGRPLPGGIGARDYGDFLRAVFDEWVRADAGRVHVQLFVEALRALRGARPTLCVMAPTCGRALAVEHDGAVYSCDHFVDAAHLLGDLGHDHLADLLEGPFQRAFGRAKRDALPRSCADCRWLALCGGGCPKDRHPGGEARRAWPPGDADAEGSPSVLCEGLQAFYDHAGPILVRLAELWEHHGRLEIAAAALRAERAASWRGVGRNAPCPCGSGRKAKLCCLPPGA